MKTSSLILITLLLFGCGQSHEQMDQKVHKGHIYGGSLAQESEFPATVSLMRKGDRPYCGGTLIAPQWVLTAAHCPFGLKARYNEEYYSAWINVTDLDNTTEKTEKILIDKVIIHEKYGQPNEKEFGLDIALIHLATPAKTAPVKMEITEVPLFNDQLEVLAVGWGGMDEVKTQSRQLRKTKLNLISKKACAVQKTVVEDAMDLNLNLPFAADMCAISDQLTSVCSGDSGGPLYRMVNGELKLIGVISAMSGARTKWKCGQIDTVNFIVRIAAFDKWLEDIISE